MTPLIRIMRDLVLVDVIEPPAKIIIPEVARTASMFGKVVATGPGRRSRKTRELTPVDMQIGDTVCFGEEIGEECRVDGRDYLIIKEQDIMGVVV